MTPPTSTMHLLEMLTSKICHDLISPVGAVANGVEFLQEMGGDPGGDVTELLSFSAGQASAKLQICRLAYGVGGADPGIRPEDVHKAMDTLIKADGKVTQNWDPYAPFFPEERPAGLCKLLTGALLFALECLPKGGSVSVESGGSPRQIFIQARGLNANMRPHFAEALSLALPPERLEPQLVHAYMTGLAAKEYGFTLRATATGAPGEQGQVSIEIGF